MYAEQNIGLRPVRQAGILPAFRYTGSGVQLRWAHSPEGLCSCRAAYHSLLEMFMGRKIIKARNVC
jgi:hypothetical protein